MIIAAGLKRQRDFRQALIKCSEVDRKIIVTLIIRICRIEAGQLFCDVLRRDLDVKFVFCGSDIIFPVCLFFLLIGHFSPCRIVNEV